MRGSVRAPHFCLKIGSVADEEVGFCATAVRLFFYSQKSMIDKNVVKNIVNGGSPTKEYFLVDVEVSPDDKIVVEIDHADGVWIEDCVELSRFIESRLSRDEEDYELEVGSAGLGQPLQVPQQYECFVGKGSGSARRRRSEGERRAQKRRW